MVVKFNPVLVTLLVVVVTILLHVSDARDAPKKALVGGWKPITDIKDHEVVETGKFAVDEHNKEAKTVLEFQEVTKGESQVVQGINYRLTISANDGDSLHSYLAEVHTPQMFSSGRAGVLESHIVSVNHRDCDDASIATSMIMAGVPLTEPYLWCYLSSLAKEERNGLKSGRLPISDTFYLMGTSHLTDTLNPQEVCVVLEHGQIYGEVLAYRNPGLQFGDIHRLLAVPVKNLGDIIGNAKYEIKELSAFEVGIPETCLRLWEESVTNLFFEATMSAHLYLEFQIFVLLLYEAPNMEESIWSKSDILNEALAIYRMTYVYAKAIDDVRTCGFAWKVVGSALCRLHAELHAKEHNQKVMAVSSSVVHKLLNLRIKEGSNMQKSVLMM
ncbi:putative RNA-dependent RNA polymerase 5 [Capsicum baccatum]|uniref:RNA-dependent RNA polymerase n=1 Tax=Capsicum baccatum TaxID=33114 RepID=A0A2G2X3F0_CAPBA|nr:putative RNA-dependent RNA polymerase 5 [Capsicum baccatum]